MRSMVRRQLTVAAGLSLWGLLALSSSPAEAACAQPMARVVSFDNAVQLKEASSGVFVAVAMNAPVCEGDSIRVGGFSRATVAFLDSGLRLTIEQNTEWVVRQPRVPGRSIIELIRGAILFFTSRPRSLDVQTPFVNAAVEGTEFLVRVADNRAEINVLEGTVALTNDSGQLTLTGGQSGQAVAGQAPQRINIRPRDAVQWALYYEPVAPPTDSLAQLDRVQPADRDSQFYVRRASLRLGVGAVADARADIGEALRVEPGNGDAYALAAIIDVALNNREGALENGRRAVELRPQSVSARIALSYAFQTSFKLEAARDELLRIVPESRSQDGPQHAVALARLAELSLSLGDLDKAVDAAGRAVAVAPNLARPQTVLGFVELTRLHTSAAKAAFNNAISLESGSPLARFGLGLAMIREGDLRGGRSEIETAAALNVEDAIIRSYLGKAYFDEKNDTLAMRQFDLAKILDPRDSTAWFYDAIRKQTLNRPVEALRDLQKSIELNDNRAVYRSRFLLDEDLAVRGARLGRIYHDLGFENVALLEGWKSLAADPGNSSAHRLLADNYLALPRHEIARDSELLQSQLLQTVNINPVQPRLADNGFGFLDDSGVSAVGFNEFTQLFATNQIRLLGDGVAGNQKTRADNLILSGLFDRWSYSVGQFHLNTDGVRQNDDLRQNIYNAFLQTDVSHRDSAQIEVRRTRSNSGDRSLLFDPQNFLTDFRSIGGTDDVRLGGRHAFSPSTFLIGSYVHRTLDSDFDTGFGVKVLTRETANFFEARVLNDWRFVNVTAGVGSYQGNLRETISIGPDQSPAEAIDVRHTNAYVYSDVKLPRGAVVSGGLSREAFSDGQLNRKPWNPKFGFSVSLDEKTTIRAASVRTLKRTLISSQTIEPTQVAGFNQFFDDVNATGAWRHGLAIDRKLDATSYVGAEASVRKLVIPGFLSETRTVIEFHNEEQLARVYVHTAPTIWLALSTDYQVERLLRDEFGIIDGLAMSRAHKLRAEGRMFGTRGQMKGLFGRLRVTFVDQRGRFLDTTGTVVPGADRFSIVDASFGRKLWGQRGVVSVDARNLFDSRFRFQDSSPEQSTLVPKRLVTVRLTVVL